MIQDKRDPVHGLGRKRIKEVRESNVELRQFKISELNFECKDYLHLMDLGNSEVTEPPPTMTLTDADTDEKISSKGTYVTKNYPCHIGCRESH